VDAANVLAYTIKSADVGDGIVIRLTELGGTQTVAHVSSDVFGVAAAERVEQDEDPGSPLTIGAAGVEVPLTPYETATIRVEAGVSWAPIALTVTKDEVSGDVLLIWTGGVSPFTLRRTEDPKMSQNPVRPVDEQPVTQHADPVLADGQTYFYVVR